MVLSPDHYISLKNASETFIHSGDTFGVPQIEAVMQAVFGDYATRTTSEAMEWAKHWNDLDSWWETKTGSPPLVRFPSRMDVFAFCHSEMRFSCQFFSSHSLLGRLFLLLVTPSILVILLLKRPIPFTSYMTALPVQRNVEMLNAVLGS
jgi:hypothetical protein